MLTSWIELLAVDVIEDPYRWMLYQSRLKPVLCPTCKGHLAKLERLAENWNMPLSEYAGCHAPAKAQYVAAIETCRACKEEVIAYWWKGVPFCDAEPSPHSENCPV